MHFTTDGSWKRPTSNRRTVLAGSPLRLFRLTTAGSDVCDAIEAGADVGASSLVDRLLDAGAIHPRPGLENGWYAPSDVTIVTPQLGGVRRPDRHVTVDDGTIPAIDGAHVRFATNRGPAAARNAGRRLVTTPLIAFVDADVTIVDEDWLAHLLPHFDDPLVGLVAPRIVGDSTASLDLGPDPALIRTGTRVSYVPAAAIVVRADAFDDVGGFDEAMRFGEDVDFVWRLDDSGWACRYEPRSIAFHAPRTSWPGRLRQQIGYGSATAPLALRHPRSLPPLRANGWIVASWISLLLGRPLIAGAMVAANIQTLRRLLPDVTLRTRGRLTIDGHLGAARQLARAIRRAWWPLVGAACLFSRRARLLTCVSIVADIHAAPTDIAYGWGVWRAMAEHRTWRPIVPEIRAWEPRRRRHRRRRAHPRTHGSARPPGAAVR